MSLSRKIALNTVISYAGRIIGSVFGLAAIGLIARSLGQEGFGEYTTILAYLSLFMILGDLALQPLMAREISQPGDYNIEELASNFFALRLAGSLIFLLAGFGLVFFFPYSEGIKLGVGVGLLGFLSLSLSQLLFAVFQKYLTMHLAALAEVIGRGVQFFLVYVIFVWAEVSYGQGGVYAERFTGDQKLFLFLAALSAAALVGFILQFFFARRRVRISLRFELRRLRKILHAAWPIALSIVLTLIYFKIDTIFLSLMKPQEDVGIYGVAYRMLESLIFFPAVFAGMIMPILSREAVSSMVRFREVFKESIRVIAIFAAPVVGGGIVLSYSIVRLIGGEGFVAAGAPMQALFVAVGLIFFGNILGRAVIALDLQKKAVAVYLSGVVLNVVLNLIFIPKFTYMGAAWTTVVTELLITSFLFWIVWSRFAGSNGERQGINSLVDIKGITKAAFAAAVMAGVLVVFVSPLTVPLSFSGLLAATALGAAVYFGVLYLAGGVSKKEVQSLFLKA